MDCFGCRKEPEFVRCTQFAGDHFYCADCAKLETDFDQPEETGWHHIWTTYKKYKEAKYAHNSRR